MLKKLATIISAFLITLAGCTSPGWHPKDKAEMYQLTGQAVMEGVHQYNQRMQERLQQMRKQKKGFQTLTLPIMDERNDPCH